MIPEIIVPSTEEIAEFRRIFFEKLEQQKDEFHKADLDRARTNDTWIGRFLSYNDMNMQNALDQLLEACAWRKDFGVNDINADNIRQEYRDSGLYYFNGKDKDGKTLFFFKCSIYTKGSKDYNDLKRVLVYWIERAIRESNDDLITPIFDMSDCGVQNIDLDYTRYIINVFKKYYPDQINYIFVYSLHWSLQATFQLIKKLLPSKAVARLKFLNSKNVEEYIDIDNIPEEWGGKNKYKYKYIPENVNFKAVAAFSTEETLEDQEHQKKVHFAQSTFSNPGVVETSSSVANVMAVSPSDHHFKNDGHLLRVTPNEAIIFSKVENDLCGQVKITNIDSRPVTYKIKTTAPEKFRVRPSTGILTKGASTTIVVMFNHGNSPATLARDKFLVMAMHINEGDFNDSSNFADVWKSVSSSSASVEQHRLRCTLGESCGDISIKNGKAYETFESSGSGDFRSNNQASLNLQIIKDSLHELRSQQRSTQRLQWLTIILFVILSISVIYILKVEIKTNSSSEYCLRN